MTNIGVASNPAVSIALRGLPNDWPLSPAFAKASARKRERRFHYYSSVSESRAARPASKASARLAEATAISWSRRRRLQRHVRQHCFSCLDDSDSNVFLRLSIQIIRVTNQPQKLRKYFRI
jgi:hypothetical protein